MKKDYTLFLISNRPERYPKIQESLLPETLYYFDGTGGPTFATLVNRCVEACSTEIVIILGDKAYPKQEHVKKMVDLIKMGHGIVGLYRFGFFGFKKELCRKIGMFDERFVPGGWEDQDMILRCVLSNISFYMTEEVEYHRLPSTWNGDESIKHWYVKWKQNWSNPIYVGGYPETQGYIPRMERTIPEEVYNYDLGPTVPAKFLTHKHFSHTTTFLTDYMNNNISSHVPVDYINQPETL